MWVEERGYSCPNIPQLAEQGGGGYHTVRWPSVGGTGARAKLSSLLAIFRI